VGVSPQNPDEFLQRAMLVGSPATVTEQISAFGDAGVRHMSLLFNFGFMRQTDADRSLDLFLEQVLPQFDAGAARR
jgi:alkanesulfonate monooxygenase SsuD/methylene tetrahydromethanopterin reductase-like flavin-dependent oxidoreductase (luciferase family)